MANFSYKKVTTNTLKASGYLNLAKMEIEVDNVPKKLQDLLADFDNLPVDFSIKIKDEIELDDPTAPSEE